MTFFNTFFTKDLLGGKKAETGTPNSNPWAGKMSWADILKRKPQKFRSRAVRFGSIVLLNYLEPLFEESLSVECTIGSVQLPATTLEEEKKRWREEQAKRLQMKQLEMQTQQNVLPVEQQS